jgi:hypothetical protein
LQKKTFQKGIYQTSCVAYLEQYGHSSFAL